MLTGLGVLVVVSMMFSASSWAAEPAFRVLAYTGPTHLPPEGGGQVGINITNVGGASTSGTPISATFKLPPGITPAAGGDCSVAGQEVTCAKATTLIPGQAMEAFLVPIDVEPGAPAEASVEVKVEGGGAALAAESMPVVVSDTPASAGVQAMWAGAFDENGRPAIDAGDHPNSAGAGFVVNTIRAPGGAIVPVGDLRDFMVDLPPGFIGNPLSTIRCPQDFPGCSEEAGVGRSRPLLLEFGGGTGELTASAPILNVKPPRGYAAQFTFKILEAKGTIVGSLRSDEDFGVTVTAPNLPTTYKIYGAVTMLEGTPAFSGGKAFLTNPTDCSELAPLTVATGRNWQIPTLFERIQVGVPAVAHCSQLLFEPTFSLQPSSERAASGVATEAHLLVDQTGLIDSDGRATPHLKDSVVTLPEGLTLNPSAGDGLEACSTAQIGYMGGGFQMPNPMRFDKEPVSCPAASKIGTAEIVTPLLEKPLKGVVYLAAQNDNPFGSLLALYIVIEDEETGITVKLPGEVVPNPVTGQLTAQFDNNPQVPFEDLTLKFRGGGPRSTLATPDVCGTYTTHGEFTPWSAPESGPPAQTTDSFTISSGPGGAPCAYTKAGRPFSLGFEAGTTVPKGGGHSPFTLRITRPDGNQELDRITLTTPPGLAATLKGVGTCSEAALAAAQDPNRTGKAEMENPSCPASSQVGTTTIGAGVGSSPLYVKTGKVYLTGPYKGAPVGLAFVVPAVAGPFDLGVQVVRTALRIDPKTAQVTAESDSIPQILKGIPLLIRDVRVDLDRPGFVLNPTNCEPMAIAGQVTGGSGAAANVQSHFQVGDCGNLGFKPRVNLRLFGGIHRAKYQGVRAVVRPRPGDANISRTVVRFPRSAFVAQENIRTICTRVQWAADACPKGSIYGRAIAYSPLLDMPLRGNVYLRSSDNDLPDAVADLRGPAHQPIKVEVAIKNDSVNGALRNTVQTAPDAPVSLFRLQMFGGKKGLIVNSRNICKGKNNARVNMGAHNGRRSTQAVPVRNAKCGKWRKAQKRKAAAKRKAKRSAHRR